MSDLIAQNYTTYGVGPDKQTDELQSLRDEREKAKNDATAYRKLSEQWNATDLELSQLKALVRAYLEARKSIDSDLAEQARENLEHALGATTPAEKMKEPQNENDDRQS